MSTRRKSGYLPSLDGWRGIAIIGVLLTHDQGGAFPLHVLDRLRDVGYMGVYLFFAISGVLITWRILEDEKATGRFDIKGFYLRRLFRIQPAAWLYLAVLAVLMLFGVVEEHWWTWSGSLLMVRNFQFHFSDLHEYLATSWFTAHYWTLSVEEHFYILLSLFFLSVKRARTIVLIALFCALILGQQIVLRHGLYSPDVSGFRTYWVIQYLLLGALMSMLLQSRHIYALAERHLQPWLVFVATFIFLEALNYTVGPHEALGPFRLISSRPPVLFCAFSFWVVATMLHPKSWTTKVLEFVPLRFVGRISYSLYLWQQLFFYTSSPLTVVRWKLLAWAGGRPQHYAAAFFCAVASYYWVEKPLIRLGHRLAPPATPGHRDMAVEIPAGDRPLGTV